MADQEKGPIEQGYVEQAAQQLGLVIPDAELTRVTQVFGNLERLAGQLSDTPIADDTVAAAVFRPPV
jgi:hypothetical protein